MLDKGVYGLTVCSCSGILDLLETHMLLKSSRNSSISYRFASVCTKCTKFYTQMHTILHTKSSKYSLSGELSPNGLCLL